MTHIIGSVGEGGKNLQVDVRAIQQLLNQVRGKAGLPPIAVDGFVGPETVGAIRAYQTSRFGWADGRVDVLGPTLAALNSETSKSNNGQVHCGAEDLSGNSGVNIRFKKSLAGEGGSTSSTPTTSSPPTAATPKATALLHKTETLAWLTAAANAVGNVNALLNSPVLTREIVDKVEAMPEWAALVTHFHIDKEQNQTKMLSKLGKLYTHMKIAVNTGDTCFDSDLDTDDFAHSDPGGFDRRSDTTNPGRMSFGIKYLFVGPLMRVVTIIHEAAHYVDKDIDHFASAVPSPSGRALTGTNGTVHAHNYAQLTPAEAMQNAASYACFAIHMAKKADTRPTITQ
ncbi:MAG: peptidoglycan-binding protein [Gemmataceae bacterium]